MREASTHVVLRVCVRESCRCRWRWRRRGQVEMAIEVFDHSTSQMNFTVLDLIAFTELERQMRDYPLCSELIHVVEAAVVSPRAVVD